MSGPASAPVRGPASSGLPSNAPRSAKPSLRKAAQIFRNRHYRYLWASSLFSFIGMQMQMVARSLLAWDLTHSFSAVGAISLSFGLPMLFFALIGGGLADRMEKRNLTLASQSVSAIFGVLMAVLVVMDAMTIELLFVIGLFSGTGMALGMPARTPLMAEVVGHEQVMSAIAMSNAAMNGTRLIGPALAGAIVGVWGLDIVYFSQAGLNVISMAILLAVPTGLGAGGSRAAKGSMFAEIGAGLKYTATDPRLRLLILMMFGITFLAMPYTMLLPGFVQEDLGRGPGAYGILQSVSGVGALVGSLVIASMTEFERKPLVQWIAGVLGGAGLIVLAVTTAMFGYAGAIGTIIFLGLTLTAYQTLNSTMLMDEARPEFYGRVMSISMMTFSAMPLMAYPLGAIADAVGAKQTFVAEGGLVLGLMAVVALVNGGYTFGRHAPAVRYGSPVPQPAPLEPAEADGAVAAPYAARRLGAADGGAGGVPTRR